MKFTYTNKFDFLPINAVEFRKGRLVDVGVRWMMLSNVVQQPGFISVPSVSP